MLSTYTNKRSLVIFSLLLVFFLGGCASISRTRLPEGSFRLDGTDYIPLVGLCNKYDIEWKWDSFAQTITLRKGGNEAKFLIDSPVVLINGGLEVINPPAKFYRGSLVIPLIFRDKIIEEFIESEPIGKQRESFDFRRYKINKIVIDPGHGGRDPGAIGCSGLKEKDINLDISKRLKKILEDEGIKVIMTRNRDTLVSLKKRVDIANRSGADLFISIHTNANRSKRLRGFEIYYLAKQSDDIRRAQITAKRNISKFSNMSMDKTSEDLRVILWDMIYTENQAESIRLAKDIFLVVSKEFSLNNRGLKSANFYVLKYTQIPSILIEVGYISNPYEEKKLKDFHYRQNIVEALAKGITGKWKQ